MKRTVGFAVLALAAGLMAGCSSKKGKTDKSRWEKGDN